MDFFLFISALCIHYILLPQKSCTLLGHHNVPLFWQNSGTEVLIVTTFHIWPDTVMVSQIFGVYLKTLIVLLCCWVKAVRDAAMFENVLLLYSDATFESLKSYSSHWFSETELGLLLSHNQAFC